MGGTYEVVREAMLQRGSITLDLDTYDDIFSDFDPRPYSNRAISEDFMRECRRAVRNKEGELTMRLLLPAALRDMREEARIRHRLEKYFEKHREMKQEELNAVRARGWTWIGIGAACMALGAFLYTRESSGFFGLSGATFLYHLILVAIEPASWFLVWEGLNTVLRGVRDHERELAFYRKMVRARVEFSDRPVPVS